MTFTAGQIVAAVQAMQDEVRAAQVRAEECFGVFAHLSDQKERAWNAKYATTEGTIPEREAATIRLLGDLYFEWKQAKMYHEHSLRMLKSKEAQLSASQSQASAKSKEMELELRFGPRTET